MPPIAPVNELRREVSGAIDQQERNARSAFQQTMDQTSCRIALSGMDQDTAVEIGVLILSESERVFRFMNSSNVVIVQT